MSLAGTFGRQAPVKRCLARFATKLFYAYGSICRTFAMSAGCTRVILFKWRMRLGFFVPIKWRFPECGRRIFPVEVTLKRLAAPRCVFSLNFFAIFRSPFFDAVQRYAREAGAPVRPQVSRRLPFSERAAPSGCLLPCAAQAQAARGR